MVIDRKKNKELIKDFNVLKKKEERKKDQRQAHVNNSTTHCLERSRKKKEITKKEKTA